MSMGKRERVCVCVCVCVCVNSVSEQCHTLSERVSVKEGVYVFTCVFIYNI